MELQTFSDERKALILGSQKINLHERGKALKPQAQNPLPGSADLCFITNTPHTTGYFTFDHLQYLYY